jgi:serine/threonine-protein kinase
MSQHAHISDAELQRVVSEQPTETPHANIETHVASCSACQQRLLKIAADESWRDDFCSSILELEQQQAFEQTNTRVLGPRQPDDFNEYDRKSIDQMLDDVLQPGSHPETLGQLGRYEVEKVIGFGGMGIVLRGFDRELHRPVAIKMISPRLVSNGTAKARFLREAKAAGALLHPNVIAIHDISETNRIPWFVMPLVVGPTLQEVVDGNGPLPASEVVRIGKQIAAGLAAAHRQGLVHRDIKPANILVDNQINRIVITDFGLARREAEESMTQTGLVAGTLNYMSPEQSRGEDVDGRSDLFSLGSLLFFLSTGVTPFRAATPMGVIHKVGNQTHNNLQSLNPAVPPQLAKMIDRLLEKDPDDRFQSASELEEWLAGYVAHLNQPVKTELPALPVKPKKKQTGTGKTKWASMALLATALPALIFYAGTWWGTRANPSLSVSPEPQITWSSVEKKYNITNTDKFEDDFSRLTRQFWVFKESQRSIEPSLPVDAASDFETQLWQLNQQVDFFDELIEDE